MGDERIYILDGPGTDNFIAWQYWNAACKWLYAIDRRLPETVLMGSIAIVRDNTVELQLAGSCQPFGDAVIESHLSSGDEVVKWTALFALDGHDPDDFGVMRYVEPPLDLIGPLAAVI